MLEEKFPIKWGEDWFIGNNRFDKIRKSDETFSVICPKVYHNIIFTYTRTHPCHALYWVYYFVFIIMDWISDIIYFTSTPFYNNFLGYCCIFFYLAPIFVCFAIGFCRKKGSC